MVQRRDLIQVVGRIALLIHQGFDHVTDIPLDYLLEHSAVLSGLCSRTDIPRSQVQRVLVKAIRLYASHLFDVQLTLHPDETVPQFGKQKEVGGGYEIRRKCIDLKSKADWDACTLYIVRGILSRFVFFSELTVIVGEHTSWI